MLTNLHKGPGKILLIEDNRGDTVIFEEYLSENLRDYSLTNAVSFSDAKNRLSNAVYDIIFLDLSLPDLSGEKLIVETVQYSKGAPVVVLTGNVDLSLSQKALSLGANDYLFKEELNAHSLFKSVLYNIERKRNQENLNRERIQALKYQSRLLSAQINPHFIFNSLNSIQYYILHSEVEKALNFVSDFSTLIRTTLRNSLADYITLESEIEFLNCYLKLEQRRFMDKFDFEIVADESIEKDEILIPPLLLQPYVENSIIHGISRIEYPGKISIAFKSSETEIVCRIEDNGIGIEESIRQNSLTKEKRHVSLATGLIATRLNVLNNISAEKYSTFSVDKEKAGENSTGTIVEIRFPKITV